MVALTVSGILELVCHMFRVQCGGYRATWGAVEVKSPQDAELNPLVGLRGCWLQVWYKKYHPTHHQFFRPICEQFGSQYSNRLRLRLTAALLPWVQGCKVQSDP